MYLKVATLHTASPARPRDSPRVLHGFHFVATTPPVKDTREILKASGYYIHRFVIDLPVHRFFSL
jgi:hypothetical protein